MSRPSWTDVSEEVKPEDVAVEQAIAALDASALASAKAPPLGWAGFGRISVG